MTKAFTQNEWTQRLRKGKPVYSLTELMRISGLPLSSAKRAVQRLVKKGMLLKLGKQLYANTFVPLDIENAAGMIYPPSYISLESALLMHGISEQVPQMLTCVSTNKTKTFHTALGEIGYFHIKEELFFGYHARDGGFTAQPEKAALDFVYIRRMNGLEPSLDEWNWMDLDVDKMISMAKVYPKTVEQHIRKFAPPGK
ncbi:MAG: helix-turn-helix domain-containing protein [Candidatus Aminicenantes bacterium]